jgi:secreted trypsin-like serine protease
VVKENDNKYTLVGVTSFGFGDTCLEGPTVFTRVSSYLPWIRSKTGLKV